MRMSTITATVAAALQRLKNPRVPEALRAARGRDQPGRHLQGGNVADKTQAKTPINPDLADVHSMVSYASMKHVTSCLPVTSTLKPEVR